MDEALKKEFQNRIVSAGRKELLLIHLEMILAEVKLAEQEMTENEERFRRSIGLTMEMVKSWRRVWILVMRSAMCCCGHISRSMLI